MIETKRVLLLVDLVGYMRAIGAMEALEVAAFLESTYARWVPVIGAHGGRVVKYMGDALLAVFPEERCEDAVEAAVALESLGGSLRCSVGVHLAIVAEGELGPDGARLFDVVGAGVNHLFGMRRGPGVVISEPVYRRLPNERRGPWRKERPPASYALAGR